jgi:2-dehydropantoate 2-reductase
MRLALFGVGAMGCLFGARLSPHADVTLVGHWPQQLDALRRDPLRVIRTDGGEYEAVLNVVDPARADHEVSRDPPLRRDFDAALILTKTGQTDQAARLAVGILKPKGIALTLQNGIGNLELIAQHTGPTRAALGTTTEGAAIVEPGVLREGGAGTTHLATREEILPQIEALAALFEQGGLHTQIARDVTGLVWGKLAISAAINPLTALLRVPNGALLESPFARGLMADAAREVAAVALAGGIALPFADAAARAEEVARLTGANRSSMLQDALRGAPTEIDAICGAVAREGERLGVPTPVNALLHRLVKAMEQAYPERLAWN